MEGEQGYAIQVDDPKPPKDELGITVGKWEVGFCDCFTDLVPNCLMVSCCPCVSLAQISARLGMTTFGCALISFILILVFTAGLGSVILVVWVWKARTITRERFQIPGGCFADYCAACCCSCCTMAQMATHIKSYKPGSCDFKPQDTLPAAGVGTESKSAMIHVGKNAPPQEIEVLPYAIEVEGALPPLAQPVGRAHTNAEGEIKVGQWDADFCGCCTDCVPNCCMATWCPCVSLAQISARLGIAPFQCSLISLALIYIFSFGAAQAVVFLWIWHARVLTRERYQLPGDDCGDCFVAFCCPCCTMAQIATHIKSYKPGSCDFGPVDTLPAYNRR
ncbi:hypothetical protein BBJ28_00024264 [Nothophytophthora sp. Chile5]|nr:hypothetical protein BBJ28_00024264 [Nothophytophthora sp. Chile5]